MSEISSIQLYPNTAVLMNEESTISPENYSGLLASFVELFKAKDYFWQAGDISDIQGWVIHLSAVASQLNDLFQTVIPILVSEKVSFTIPADKETAMTLLNGGLGIIQLGKIITVYPDNDELALLIAKKLVAATTAIKGPVIPTDIALGNVVYTRYSRFHPLLLTDANGNKNEYLYDPAGKLIKDTYSIPFQPPHGINWPFDVLASTVPKKPKTVLNHIYKPLFLLKPDISKGDVYKGIYVKSLFRVVQCVIKQGRKNMVSDEAGRDVYDRLIWQQELHKELAGIIPLPKIYDLFVEDGDSYLVMEFIKGCSLYDRMRKLNFSSKSWFELHSEEKSELLDYILQIVSVLKNLHHHGYIHRDMAPGNFLIDSRGQIILIDMELAYSVKKAYPHPPFESGTPGFMSPQQQAAKAPSPKEDIYGLGALMTILFTGLSPIRFDTSDNKLLISNLNAFIGNHSLAAMIGACMNQNPAERPELNIIQNILNEYRVSIVKADVSQEKPPAMFGRNELENLITASLQGLINQPIVQSGDIWYSQNIDNITTGSHSQKEYSVYGGLYQGLAGVLYVISRAHLLGFNVDSCLSHYTKSWQFIEENYFSCLPNLSPGLYNGASGIALSLAEAIRGGLMENSKKNRSWIRSLLELKDDNLDLTTGVTGQGIALLQCIELVESDFFRQQLDAVVLLLLKRQEKDGSWLILNEADNKKGLKNMRFGNGIPGILFFLLAYYKQYPSNQLLESINKTLNYILKRTHNLEYLFKGEIFKKMVLDGVELGDERKGIILVFIKAYEVIGNENYKFLAERALMQYPPCMVKTNFSQDTGLAGLGELYLEAFRVFGNSEWENRANWIAKVYNHTCYNSGPEKGKYWIMEERSTPTADFMIGTSGIIHFLLRCFHTNRLGYRLLN
ncbi:lanthionine synthetase LanC family protein [Flavitalea sp. BT771]|uniref:class III lanthionine synthetase LanKC N-terminal domain-containing protein n=1 Tax=Flavitalea sp. BT771 TaxID=3063329 RepID=UPI0026E3F14B|nr:lanthionine synthetase LanC family protein [Flavitalea sp. BT771]MDO6433885.1 lanthionine synthetase LanC family protein [Flavitalea sp. BT771]MDV6222210.1 lanthionine synthetase LanC family protein [Flavitalea sp. BT771]